MHLFSLEISPLENVCRLLDVHAEAFSFSQGTKIHTEEKLILPDIKKKGRSL